jgi:hypothetical protein
MGSPRFLATRFEHMISACDPGDPLIVSLIDDSGVAFRL